MPSLLILRTLQPTLFQLPVLTYRLLSLVSSLSSFPSDCARQILSTPSFYPSFLRLCPKWECKSRSIFFTSKNFFENIL
jgi:hypothetical protein